MDKVRIRYIKERISQLYQGTKPLKARSALTINGLKMVSNAKK